MRPLELTMIPARPAQPALHRAALLRASNSQRRAINDAGVVDLSRWSRVHMCMRQLFRLSCRVVVQHLYRCRWACLAIMFAHQQSPVRCNCKAVVVRVRHDAQDLLALSDC